MGGEHFSVRPSAGGGWHAVAAALGRKLRLVEDAGPAWCATLSVADGERNLYSQAFVPRGEPLYARSRVRSLPRGGGWSAPSRPARRPHRQRLERSGLGDAGRSWPNWYRYFGGPSCWEEAAQAMVFAVADILGVEESDVVCLHVFPAASAGTTLEEVA